MQRLIATNLNRMLGQPQWFGFWCPTQERKRAKRGLTVAIAASSLVLLGTINPAHAQTCTASLPLLTVTGQGHQTLLTTLASVNLAVDVSGPTAEAVQQEIAQRSSDLIDFLNNQPIEQLETTGIRLNPRYDYDDGNQRLIGYTASNTVRFEIAIDAAGELLDEAVQAGATRIDGIQFRATEDAIAIAQRQALQAATLDAQKQADAVLAALGFTRKEIVGIQVNHAQPPVAMTRQSTELRAAAAPASTPVVGSEQTVQASVTLQIQY